MSIQSLSLFGYQGKNQPATFGGNYSRQSAGAVNPFSESSTKTASPLGGHNQNGADGLVARLDRMDASMLKPEHQCDTRANKLDLFA